MRNKNRIPEFTKRIRKNMDAMLSRLEIWSVDDELSKLCCT